MRLDKPMALWLQAEDEDGGLVEAYCPAVQIAEMTWSNDGVASVEIVPLAPIQRARTPKHRKPDDQKENIA